MLSVYDAGNFLYQFLHKKAMEIPKIKTVIKAFLYSIITKKKGSTVIPV